MKKSLIIGLVLVFICIGLTIYNEFINARVNINTITNKGLKEENTKVYLDATFIAGSIKYDNKDYYVIFGDGVQYLVLIEEKEALKINNYLMDNTEDSYRIIGTTKLIPEGILESGKKFVNNWLDNNHTHEEEHSHNITDTEFYKYFGYVYLETTDFELIKIFIYITGITGTIFIISYINTKFHFI